MKKLSRQTFAWKNISRLGWEVSNKKATILKIELEDNGIDIKNHPIVNSTFEKTLKCPRFLVFSKQKPNRFGLTEAPWLGLALPVA